MVIALALVLAAQTSAKLDEPPDIPVHKTPLTLEQALEYAETYNERIGLAAADVESARSQWWTRLSELLPRAQVNGVYTRRAFAVRFMDEETGGTTTIQRLNALSGQGTFELNVLKPDAYPRLQAADREIRASRSDAQQARLDLRFDAADQFFATLAAERVAEAARRRVSVAQATVDDARERLNAGLTAGNTVTRAELALATARVTATESSNTAEIARLTLSFILGVDVLGTLVEPKESGSRSEDSRALYQRARSDRFDLKALRLRREGAEKASLAPSLDWLPELSVQGLYTLTNEAGFVNRSTNWSIFATLGWQLFDGGARIGEAVETKAALHRVDLQIRSLERDVRLRIENQLRQINASRALVSQAEAQLMLASQNVDEVQSRLKAGLATGLEAADAAASLFDAQAELERQRFQARIAELGLRRELASDPLEPVSLSGR